MLREYLRHHWKANPNQLLFPAPRRGGFARSRNNVARAGLKPILQKLGLPAKNVGIHAFRHGLATELAESEPITVLQTQMRHTDVRTTLTVYAHVIPQSQRDSMERIAKRSIGTNVPIGTQTGDERPLTSKCCSRPRNGWLQATPLRVRGSDASVSAVKVRSRRRLDWDCSIRLTPYPPYSPLFGSKFFFPVHHKAAGSKNKSRLRTVLSYEIH